MTWQNKHQHIQWPSQAVVTAGMPYGNKALHFGHVGGVFVPADCYARFLRCRIGAENVCFVSGTDCFGSPIEEGYRKEVESGAFTGSLSDYVQRNHDAQKATLDAYDISLDVYEGSGIGLCGSVHEKVSAAFVQRLYERGFLHLESTLQFYDEQEHMFLNGRQVVGHCPVQGCKSTKAYADECELGHQYNPVDLLNPVSSVSNTVPVMRNVQNWYFDLPALGKVVRAYAASAEADEQVRAIVTKTIEEFLVAPIIYVKVEFFDAYEAIRKQLPAHTYRPAPKGKQSFELEFESVAVRDKAREVLSQASIRFRTGKALVPFRISGNVSWGVPIPEINGVSGLSVWCWPESLWAPISFTIARNKQKGLPEEAWRDFWCNTEACVYQFIGQDNLYFYGVAQPALFAALQEGNAADAIPNGQLQQTKLVANHHILFGNKKASSSDAVKPPSADELLNFYTPEQLRAHFLALALDQKSVGFKPKVFDADEQVRNDPRVADPVLKEGALLTKVFNRLARSCLYEAAKNFDGYMPLGVVTPDVLEHALDVISTYEELMYKVDLHSVMALMDEFIRKANKYWSSGIKEAETSGVQSVRRQVLLDSFYLLRVSCLLMYPVVPSGTTKICQYLNFDEREFFSWQGSLDNLEELCSVEEVAAGKHKVQQLPPRTDFFEFHESQRKK